MTHPILNFTDMISPVSPEHFLVEIWETRPLHLSRGQPDFYRHLLTKGDVDRAISAGGLRFPGIQLAKGGGFLPAAAFTRNIRSGDDIFTGVPNLDRLRAEYQSGATISLPAFHRACKPLGLLAGAIEAEFSHAVHANVYLTPGNAAGFTPHFDTHEVFVLQIAGSKHWTIRKPPVTLPHRSQVFDPGLHAGAAPLLELDLEPGDLLYLPRGFVHSTSTADGFSLHVTVGITVYTWVELLSELVQAHANNLRFRRALPPGFARDERAADAIKREFLDLVAALNAGTQCSDIVDRFAHRARRARAMQQAEFDADVTLEKGK